MRLAGKVALISGGAKGMGAAEAGLFAREGACVVIGDVLEEEGKSVAEGIRREGGKASFVRLDVTVEEEWRAAVSKAEREYGKLNVLVNNAGVFWKESLEKISVERWERLMSVNVTGVFLGTKACIPAMRRAGGGSIINISSTSGLVGSAETSAYHASKGAVRIFTKATAVEYAREGIRANSVHPGPIETDMIAELMGDAGYRKSQMEAVPLKRFGRVEDVAYGVLYLASDESSYMTGAELVIDGGKTGQ
ncbi:MAG: glucose 1-dehydrogenase [SAR202 cluster bacterium]|nr:glucose 1-dehydrogenase [SAR202 cluster bacterium]